MTPNRLALLGLFPRIGPEATGGIEHSGWLAWTGLKNIVKCRGERVLLFCYVPDKHRAGPPATSDVIALSGKFRGVMHVLRHRLVPEEVLIWHLGLLKLLPFVRSGRTRVVLFLHGIEVWHRLPLSLRWLLRRVDLFLANSEHTWRRFVTFNPEFQDRPHRVVPLGVGIPFKGEVPPPEDRPIALMLGRMVKSEDYKGHREVISAWPRVLQRISDVTLWIVGDGDLRPELERMAHERGLEHHVRFWGWVSEEEKQELLLKSRCLALPSRSEGFGLVYLEAMRLGRPCLVSTLDAGREVVNPPEAGLAVDPRDPQALADALCRLLTPGPEWDRWSAQAKARYERQFTAAHFQKRLVEALGLG